MVLNARRSAHLVLQPVHPDAGLIVRLGQTPRPPGTIGLGSPATYVLGRAGARLERETDDEWSVREPIPRRPGPSAAPAHPAPKSDPGKESVILTVTPIAGRGAEGDRREPRPGQSGCHRGPGSTFRSSPRARLPVPGGWGLRPPPAGRARRGRP